MYRYTFLIIFLSGVGIGEMVSPFPIIQKELGPCVLYSDTTDSLLSPGAFVKRVIYKCRDNVAFEQVEEVVGEKMKRETFALYGRSGDLKRERAISILTHFGKPKDSSTKEMTRVVVEYP